MSNKISYFQPSKSITDAIMEDKIDEKNGIPPRFGLKADVNLNTENSGLWTNLPNGDKLWRLSIESIGAKSINLIYDAFHLPKGGTLHIYNNNKSHIIGGFTELNNKGTIEHPGKFASGLVYGDKIILEYYHPAKTKVNPIISITGVIHGYKYTRLMDSIAESTEAGYGDSGSCQVNINCSEGNNWQSEKKGIAMLLIDDGRRWCTGSLVNNTSLDNKPYFLTANHCLNEDNLDANGNIDASMWMFYWNYETPSCVNGSSEPTINSTSGATLRANRADSDFALFELMGSPLTAGYEPYFNGWNRTNNPGQGGVGIHHPNGDVKKIATHNVVPGPGQIWSASTHFRVNWLQTTNGWSVTEGGSSGSPLFTTNGHIIGQLHGGSAINCANPAADPGEYGRFGVSWNGVSASRRLSDWLDPNSTNIMVLDGKEATPVITGTSLVCNSPNQTFTLTNTTGSVTWQVSSNLQIVSSSNTSVTVSAINTSINFSGFVKAITATATVQKDVWVGTQPVDTVEFTNGIYEEGFFCTSHYNNVFQLYPSISGNYYQYRLLNHPSLNVVYTSQVINGASDTVYYIPPVGWYVFEARMINSCGTSDWFGTEVEFVDCTHMDGGGGGEQRFAVYPNPSSSEINISYKNTSSETIRQPEPITQLKLYDFVGNVLMETKGSNLKNLNVTNMKVGIYYLEITSNDIKEIHSVVIDR